MGSQIQMTSMTLIRESQSKGKYSQQAEMEKKKLQEIITKKDQEIEELNQKIGIMKNNHSEEIDGKNLALKILTEKNEQLDK